MNEQSTTGASGLGGRLPLLVPTALDRAQRDIYTRLQTTRLRSAEGAGYLAVLPDGRLIGPFNAMLRNPRIAQPLLEWAQAITRADIAADVREVVILTVAAQWRAEYALYAHTTGARCAGVPEAAIAALRHGDTPGVCAPRPTSPTAWPPPWSATTKFQRTSMPTRWPRSARMGSSPWSTSSASTSTPARCWPASRSPPPPSPPPDTPHNAPERERQCH
ncbi:hypothetical protein [Nocardia niigatensis]|uniref:hypothetical protein n=1 Tax=Nocardia niigatensis TaxID=209249 RepID=UPI001C3F3DCD|nr:hypothetical protein [Nocardia niigatensis]